MLTNGTLLRSSFNLSNASLLVDQLDGLQKYPCLDILYVLQEYFIPYMHEL
jgi:hypothetical protein